jgi:hypothetical protein
MQMSLQKAPSGELGSSVSERFFAFFKERSAQKAALYGRILSIGWTMLLLGILLIAIGARLKFNYAVLAFASFFTAAGCCVFSTIPTDEFNIDDFVQAHPILRSIACVSASALMLLYAVVFGPFAPYLGWLSSLFSVWVLMSAFSCNYHNEQANPILGEHEHAHAHAHASPAKLRDGFFSAYLTTKIIIFGNFAFFNLVITYFMQGLAPRTIVDTLMIHDWLGYGDDWATHVESRPGAQAGNVVQAVVFGIGGILSTYYTYIFYFRTSPFPGWRTSALYVVLYCWLNATGVGQVLFGVYAALGYQITLVPINVSMYIITAVGLLLPAVGVVCLGTRKSFSLLARSFDHDKTQMEEDGALMAELVSACQVLDLVTKARWEYRKSECKTAPQKTGCINTAFWVLGRIADVQNQADGVELEIDFHLRENQSLVEARYNGHVFQTISRSDSSSSAAWKFEEWSASNFSNVFKSDASREVVTLKKNLTARKSTRRELLIWARSNLRSFQWEAGKDLDPMLFGRSPRDLKTDEEKIQLYGLSKDCNTPDGKKIEIDYFISHSWLDNAKIKCDRLSAFAKKFYTKNKRMPVFWFDKTCIDQMDTSNALAVLPINIAASRKLLILLGETYMTRLWCVWELFTLVRRICCDASCLMSIARWDCMPKVKIFPSTNPCFIISTTSSPCTL